MKYPFGLLLGLILITLVYAEDPTARSQKVFLVPTAYQIQIDYQSGTNPIYVGTADKGLPTNVSNWFIQNITWDASNNPTSVKVANNVAWDDRNSTTFQ